MTVHNRKTKRSKDTLPEEIRQLLQQHPVFCQIRQTNWVRLLEASHVREYGTGESICREGQAATSVWLLIKGEVKLVLHTTKGQVLLVDIILPGELFGAVFYTSDPVYPTSAFTLKPTRIISFPLAILIDELQTNFSLQTALLEDTCLKLCQSIVLRGLALEEVPERIASILCRLHQKFGPVIPETRATLAELAGTTTESAIRVTREMEKQGLLRLRRGSIQILSVTKLQEQSVMTSRHDHGIHSPISGKNKNQQFPSVPAAKVRNRETGEPQNKKH